MVKPRKDGAAGKKSAALKVKRSETGVKRFKPGKSSGGKKKDLGVKKKERFDSKRKDGLKRKSGDDKKERKKRKPEVNENEKAAEEGENERSAEENENEKDASRPQKKSIDRKAKKEILESRKKKRKPNYDLEKEVVFLWEKMRQRDIKPEERSRIATKTLEKMKGKLLQMAMSHATSRVLQSCVKHCQAAERDEVFKELKPHLLDLAVNTYACHLAQRMLDHAKKDQLQQLLSALHGNVVRLMRHPCGSAVVEHAYHLANATGKQNLVTEFFSPEYRLFRNVDSGRGRLVDILSGEPATKHKAVLEHMTLAIQPILEKGIVDHSLFHRVLAEYLSISPAKMVRGVVEQLAGPLILRMLHTADGAKISVLCVRNGSPKERKKIVKALKGEAIKVAQDDHGYAVLISIFEAVDDTDLVNKFIMTELAKAIKDLSLNKYGQRVILYLLSPKGSRYFPPELLKMLQNPIESFSRLKKTEEDDTEMKDTEDVNDMAEMGVSKKDPLVRRTELLLKSGFAEKLAEACAANAGELLRSAVGKDVIYEVARGGVDGITLKATEKGISSVHKAIADLAASPKDKETEEHVLEHYHASRTIRRLVLDGSCHTEDGSRVSFAECLWHHALEGRCKAWAQGHSEKVIAAFRDSGDPAVKRMAKAEIDSLISAGLLAKHKPITGAAK